MSNNLYYGYSKEVHELAEKYIQRDILACQSGLVDSLIKLNSELPNNDHYIEEYSYENVENLSMNNEALLSYYDYENYSDLAKEEFIENARNDGSDIQEIFEWWLVSNWLATQLLKQGEPILTTAYGSYWGRTCTGQSIILDGTIQKIAEKYI